MIAKEKHFEATIEADLIMSGGCLEGDPENFDPVRGVVQGEVLGFGHEQGVVARIDKRSQQLADHLEKGTRSSSPPSRSSPSSPRRSGSCRGRPPRR